VYSPNVIWLMKSKGIRLMGHVALWEIVDVYRVLVGKPEGKRPHGTENIKMDLQAVEWGMDWIDLSQDGDRWWVLVNVMDLWIP